MPTAHETTPHTAVVGLQWGDEGKGKIVDLLTEKHDVIVRYNGGANAGHTIVVGDQRYAVHLIPTGILHPDKLSVIGNGVVVDPEKLLEEIRTLRQRGLTIADNLVVSDRAHVVMPYHKDHDAALEQRLSAIGFQPSADASGGRLPAAGGTVDRSIGTTKRGIGPCYADKVHRSTAIRMGDLLDISVLRAKLRVTCGIRAAELAALNVDAKPLDPDALAEQYAAFGRDLSPHITDTVYLLHEKMNEGRSILFEGANACLLDIDHGTYPYVTSSNCSTLGIPAGTGIPGKHVQNVIGIMKAYSTRVGGGPFPTEIDDDIAHRIRERGREYGTTTGRPRRVGWLDLVAVKYSAMICGATSIACMLLDVLSGLEEIKLCTGYRLSAIGHRQGADAGSGKPTASDRFIPDAERLARVEPIYETLPGWDEELDSLPAVAGKDRSRAGLPANARRYLDRIEEFIGIPIEIVSIGPERTQTLVAV
jgi:adenylosuccinate synthase